MKYINKEIYNHVDYMKKQFSQNKPFKHIFIENFLEEEFAEKLISSLKKEKFEEKESDLFHLHQTRDFFNIKKGFLREFYEYIKSEQFLDIVQRITGSKLNKNIIDLAGSMYKNTNFLLCHDDELSDRKIAFLFYLSKNFKEENGDSLVLFDSKNGSPDKAAKKYLPKWNSFLMFEVSNISFHEVEEVVGDKERYAVGGWFH